MKWLCAGSSYNQLKGREMGRIAWIAVALVLLTAAPAAQAGLLHAAENTAKAAAESAAKAGAKGAEVTANGVKIENKGGLEAHEASVEANAMKVETPSGSGGGSGDDSPPVWFYVLCVVGVVSWLLWNFRGKPA
jgi:hypothetical protein